MENSHTNENTAKNHYIKELEQINLILNKITESSNTKTNNESRLDTAISELEYASIYSKTILKNISSKPKLTNQTLEVIHHNIRAPLTSIKAYADLILQDKFGNTSNLQKEKLRIASDDINTLKSIISKLFQHKIH